MMYASPLLRLFVGELRSFNPRGLLFNVGLIPGDKPALTNDAKFDRFWGRSEDRVRPGFTWSFFDETLKLGARARTAAAQTNLPVIVLTGDKDPIGTAGVGQRAFARLMRRIPAEGRRDRGSQTAIMTLSTTATNSRRSSASATGWTAGFSRKLRLTTSNVDK